MAGDRLVAVNIVVCYEEGAEYSLFEGDDRSDGWGEYPLSAAPGIRDLGTETHFKYGSRVGIWRIARTLERYGANATISGCAEALQRNPEVTAWLRGFHHIIQDAAGSERLVQMIRELETSFPGNYCYHEIAPSGEAKVVQVDEHDAIRAAIRERDAVAARRLMRDHILHSKDLLLAHLDEHGFWFGREGAA